MLNNLWEFFFCPQHGIFAPANWQAIAPVIGQLWNQIVTFGRYLWNKSGLMS